MAVDFYRHSLGEEEKAVVRGVLDSLFLTTGQKVYAFENAFEDYLGVAAVVCTAHATASLHLAMLAAGIGPGEEVVTTGGIYGVITSVKDDRFVVRISESTKVEIAKGFITSVVKPSSAGDKK